MQANEFSFFRQKNNNVVAEIATPAPLAVMETPAHPKLSLVVGWQTDVGRVRELNEDALFTLTAEFQQGEQATLVGVFAVADGMGGYEHGEKASALAIHVAANSLLHSLVGSVFQGEHSSTPLYETLQAATLAAHTQIRENFLGAGTTLTLAAVIDDSLAVAFVGDTRAYHYAAGQLRQVTTDHTWVQKLLDTGQMTPEEAMHNPKNLLLRALGQSEELEVDFRFSPFESGNRLLLCSDGLWGLVAHETLERIVREATDPQVACQELIRLANAAAGHDNITALLVIAR